MHKLSLPPAMLFDLDDTIIAFDAVSIPVWISVCNKYSQNFKGDLFGAIMASSEWYWSDKERHRIGRGNLKAARRQIVTMACEKLGVDNKDLAYEIADTYSQSRLDAMYLFPGAIETLTEIKNQGVRLVMVTNGEAQIQRYKINRFKLEPFFDAIFIEGEVGFGKPEEAFYKLALKSIDASPEQSWIIGDNLEWEIEYPKRLGFYTVWHDHSSKGLPPGCSIKPDKIIYSLPELLSNRE